REGDPALQPQLVIIGGGPGTPEPTPTGTPAATPTPSVTPGPTLEPTPEPTGEPSGGGTLAPIADARVSAGKASTNYGTTTTLIADMSPMETSYLMFDVQGLSGPATGATLRLYVSN